MAGSTSTSSTIKGCIVLYVFLAGQTIAHEHHDDKIPEGSAISPDPIVQNSLSGHKDVDRLTFFAGFDIMGPHCRSGPGMGCHIPHRHGSWSECSDVISRHSSLTTTSLTNFLSSRLSVLDGTSLSKSQV